jgi:hypothetical protein
MRTMMMNEEIWIQRMEGNKNNVMMIRMEEMIIPGVVNASAAVCAVSHVE